MFKSFTNINSTNDRFLLHTQDTLGVKRDSQIIIPHGNYKSINSITIALEKEGFYDGQHYVIVCTPNIVGSLNGLGNGISNYDMKPSEDYIMSSEIRQTLREEGKL